MESCYEIQIIFSEDIERKVCRLWKSLRNKGITGFLLDDIKDVPHVTLLRTTSSEIDDFHLWVCMKTILERSLPRPLALCFQAVSSWEEGGQSWGLHMEALQSNDLMKLRRVIFSFFRERGVLGTDEFEAESWTPMCPLAKQVPENLVSQAYVEAVTAPRMFPLLGFAWKVQLVTYNKRKPVADELGLAEVYPTPRRRELLTFSLPQAPRSYEIQIIFSEGITKKVNKLWKSLREIGITGFFKGDVKDFPHVTLLRTTSSEIENWSLLIGMRRLVEARGQPPVPLCFEAVSSQREWDQFWGLHMQALQYNGLMNLQRNILTYFREHGVLSTEEFDAKSWTPQCPLAKQVPENLVSPAYLKAVKAPGMFPLDGFAWKVEVVTYNKTAPVPDELELAEEYPILQRQEIFSCNIPQPPSAFETMRL